MHLLRVIQGKAAHAPSDLPTDR